jgi:hypothetical protein
MRIPPFACLPRRSQASCFKKWIMEDCGRAFGFDYIAFFQAATESPIA